MNFAKPSLPRFDSETSRDAAMLLWEGFGFAKNVQELREFYDKNETVFNRLTETHKFHLRNRMKSLRSKLMPKDDTMVDYDNTNKFMLSRNTKRRNDKDAEFTGNANITCPHCDQTSDHWLNAWVREKKADGSKFFGGTTRAKDTGTSKNPKSSIPLELDDQIPF